MSYDAASPKFGRLQAWLSARPKVGPMDPVLAAVVIALLGFGVVMVYSASAAPAAALLRDPQYYLKRQGLFALASLGVMWATSHIDYHRIRPLTYWILGVVTLLLLMCVLGFGHAGGGAKRWLVVGSVHIQPAEMAKLGLVLWLSYSLSKKAEKIRTFLIGFLPHLLVAGFLMVLCLKPARFRQRGRVALLDVHHAVRGRRQDRLPARRIDRRRRHRRAARPLEKYRLARYLAWLDMDKHRQDLAYQPFQSVMSFGSGGLSGLGLGRGFQALYLPEAHTDFIAAIIGEELGFMGVLGLCAAYLLLVSRGVRIALTACDDYGSFIAFGISTMFGVQALVNLAVAMAILPTKGLTLPFLSYGGSSLLVNAAAAGILLSVSRYRRVSRAAVSEKLDAPEASAVIIGSADQGAA